MTDHELADRLDRLARERTEKVAMFRLDYVRTLREAAVRLRQIPVADAVHPVYGDGMTKEAPMETTKQAESVRCPTCHREVGIDAESRKVLFHLRQSATGGACPSSLLSVVLVTGGRVR